MMRALFGPMLFIVLGVAMGYGLDRVRHELAPPEDIDLERVRIERLLQYSEIVNTLSVGNSHSLAVDLKALNESGGGRNDVRGYHVWTRGQDLFELEVQLRYLLPRLPEVDTLLFAVSYGSFHRDNGASTDAERGMVRSLWYASAPHYGMIGVDTGNYFKGLMTHGLVTPDHWLGAFDGLKKRLAGKEKPKRLYGELMKGDGQLEVVSAKSFRPRSHEELTREARDTVLPRHHRLQQNMAENNPDMEADAVACMKRIIELTQEQGVRVLFYTPPYHPAYASGFDSDTKSAMRAHMAQFVETLGIEYHDFSEDPEFTQDAANFVNSDHMSPVGSAAFSGRRLRPLLEAARKH